MNARTTLAMVTCLALAACQSGHDNFDKSTQYGPDPQLPAPSRALLPGVNVSKVIGWSPGETPTVPQGFKIEAIATGLSNPRNVLALPNGDLLVVESQKNGKEPIERPKRKIMDWVEAKAHGGSGNGPSNRILLLRDTNGDGKPDAQSVLIDKLNAPFGIALVGDQLYIADTDAILRYPYKVGDTKVGGDATKVCDLPAGAINHHWTKSLAASADGSKLYVGVGSNSNILERGTSAEMNRADILEVDPRTGAFSVFAHGLRNPNGLTFYPGSDVLWTVVNERDELGSDLVPDYLTAVRDGAFYGWPYSYYGPNVDKRVKPQRPDLVAKAIKPDYALGSHVAALGLAVTNEGAYIGQHGSWNRKPLSGYNVVFVPFSNGKPSGQPQEVLTGFVNSKGEAYGRPVGVAFDKRGGLLVADDVGNAIWRVAPR
jgi:glucose/arabinose dehydrogenase